MYKRIDGKWVKKEKRAMPGRPQTAADKEPDKPRKVPNPAADKEPDKTLKS